MCRENFDEIVEKNCVREKNFSCDKNENVSDSVGCHVRIIVISWEKNALVNGLGHVFNTDWAARK